MSNQNHGSEPALDARRAAKEMRERDAALAIKEYRAEKISLRLRTERLRALRLAAEATAASTKLEQKQDKS